MQKVFLGELDSFLFDFLKFLELREVVLWQQFLQERVVLLDCFGVVVLSKLSLVLNQHAILTRLLQLSWVHLSFLDVKHGFLDPEVALVGLGLIVEVRLFGLVDERALLFKRLEVLIG